MVAPARPQDLFLDSLIDAPIKSEQAGLEHPFFSLEKRPRMEPIRYEHGPVKIEVSAGPKGLATIHDKDLLIYCASVINDRLERGEPVSPKVTFAAHDFLRVTERGVGKRSYDLFLDALDRLQTTGIKTSIEAGDQRERRTFTWIASSRVIEDLRADGTRRMKAVEIELCDWMFRAVAKDRRVLTISPSYFRITSGVERRLYELARKHVGRQPEWVVSLPRLAEKVGTSRTLRSFKFQLKDIIERDPLPDYSLSLAGDPRGELERAMKADGFAMKGLSNERIMVRFWPKDEAAQNGPRKPIGLKRRARASLIADPAKPGDSELHEQDAAFADNGAYTGRLGYAH